MTTAEALDRMHAEAHSFCDEIVDTEGVMPIVVIYESRSRRLFRRLICPTRMPPSAALAEARALAAKLPRGRAYILVPADGGIWVGCVAPAAGQS